MPTTKALTDFRCYLPGRCPEDWSPRFGATSAPYLVASTDPDPPEATRLACSPSSSSLAGIRWDTSQELAGDGIHEDQEAVVKFRMLDGGFQTLLALRISGASTGAANGYYLRLDALGADLNVGVWKLLAGTSTRKGRDTIAVGLGWNWARFRCEYNGGPVTLSVKIWADGATEPGSWDFTASDTSSTVPDGDIGLLTNATIGYQVDAFGWAVDGGTAPGAESIPRSLAEALADPAAGLAWTCRIESYDVAEEAERVDWYAHQAASAGTNYRDYPASTRLKPLLIGASPDSDELAEDSIFGGAFSRSPGSVTLSNRAGEFVAGARTYAGRRLTLYLGEASQAHVWHAPVSTSVMPSDPEIRPQDGKITIQLAVDESDRAVGSPRDRGVLPNLNRPLDIGRLVGIPTSLATGGGTIASATAYAVTSYVVFLRFFIFSTPGSTQKILQRETSSTARQFRFDIQTDGKLRFTASCAGTANAIDMTTAESVVGRWFWACGVVDDAMRMAYLLTPDDELSQATTGSVNTPATSILVGYGGSYQILDLRLFDGGPSLERIRSLCETRVESSEAGLLLLCRFDDGGSSTVATDYVAANNCVLAGTLGVDYTWEPTDLGDAQMAGKLMGATEGLVFNAEAELRDALRFRYGFNDQAPPLDPESGNPEWKVSQVRARGVPLALTTDYTLPTTPNGGAIDLVSGGSGSEPITFDTAVDSEVYPGVLLPHLLANIGERRGALDRDLDLDREAWEALRAVYPWPAGLHWSGESPILSEVWANALGGVGAHLRADRAGRAVPGTILRPINPGPYGLGNFLEFSGAPNSGVVFPELDTLAGANVLNALTIVMWVKVHAFNGDAVAAGYDQATYQEFLSTISPDGTTGLVCGVSAERDGSLLFGAPGITSQLGDIGSPFSKTKALTARSGEWWLVAFKLTASNGLPAPTGNYQRTTYGAPLGAAAVKELNSQTVHGTRTAGTQVRIGRGLAGSVAYVAIYDDDLVVADLTPMLSAPPTQTNALFWASLGEGAGALTCLDEITGTVGTIQGARWCPALRLDCDRLSAGRVTSLRSARPMWWSEVAYRRNYLPMAESDIAAGVTDRADRAALRAEAMYASDANRPIRSIYLRARDAQWEAPVLDATYARTVAKMYAQRVAPGTMHAEVSVDARIHALRLLDEIHLLSTAADLPEWTIWRAVSRQLAAVDNERASDRAAGTLSLWGGFTA